MNDFNLTDYSYEVQIDHSTHNALSDQGTYLEIAGIIYPPTMCLGPMYVNHIAKIKSHFASLPKVHVGETDCRNATLTFNMEPNDTLCYMVDAGCNNLCFCPTLKALCAPRCSCPEQTDEDEWSCQSHVQHNMVWFQKWLGNHGKIIPKVLRQGLYYICGNKAYSWLPMGATSSSIHALNEELAQVRKVALQNRMAFDYLLAIEGGTCAIIGSECCTWVEDTHDPIEAHLSKVKQLQQQARDISKEGWNPFSWMGSIGV
ncbi:uncharacterized protein O3C94_023535 [Discoglossus pictus]